MTKAELMNVLRTYSDFDVFKIKIGEAYLDFSVQYHGTDDEGIEHSYLQPDYSSVDLEVVEIPQDADDMAFSVCNAAMDVAAQTGLGYDDPRMAGRVAMEVYGALTSAGFSSTTAVLCVQNYSVL